MAIAVTNVFTGRSPFSGKPVENLRSCVQVPSPSAKPEADALECDALEFRGPGLARLHRQRTGQCAGGKQIAGRERRIVGVALKQAGHVTDDRQRSFEHVRAAPAVHQRSIAKKLDLEFRYSAHPPRSAPPEIVN